ncbi:GNAT family N-acetyltransferase [Clostridium sp. BJN0001]|uniref:GNAT family N-acetyltransferase n=1 Tax=Clostridium sp. BJN0001 TaxID=2930219 RepID=UPI001FD340A9|nr:GNAT family N-acetyltransferase [Clostridium sp. BJN0001]
MNLEKVTLFNIRFLRRIFNENQNCYDLDGDFFDVYNEESFIYKFLLRKQVKLIKLSKSFIGYIWLSFSSKSGCYNIYGIDINENYINLINSKLLRSLKFNILNYECIDSKKNDLIMSHLEFSKINSSILMSIKTNPRETKNDKIEFVKLIKGQDEEKRCIIQNKIFDKKGRVPISVDDILEEENSSYYIDGLSFFIVSNHKHIGYGQIILSHGVHTIVNFGIIKEYRKSGYGKKFIDFLINYCFINSIDNLNIRVEDSNIPAIKLYKCAGFSKINGISKWSYSNL